MKTIIALSVTLVSAAASGDDRPAKNPEGVSEKSAQTKFEARVRHCCRDCVRDDSLMVDSGP
jgi:hypothetical protein